MILSEEQRGIVELDQGSHIVLAPPGTGKTELLAMRAEHALKSGVHSEHMVCLTFTNRAAKEMKERVDERHPGNGLFVGNIHRFCARHLFKKKLIPRFASLLDETESGLLLEECKKDVGYNGETKNDALLRLNAYLVQTEKEFPQEILQPPSKEEITSPEGDRKVCEKYREIKRRNVLLDYDDLLIDVCSSLRGDASPSLRYSWIQVDEAQDLNPLQWEIIRLIGAPDAHRVFFGDCDQAIFSFMGAKMERLLDMRSECGLHTLRTNYRSPSYLLEVFDRFASALFPESRVQAEAAAATERPEENALLLAEVNGTNEEEAELIVDRLLPGLLAKSQGQTAILVRSNRGADLYSRLLQERKREHFKISGQDLFHSRVVKDLLAFLFCLSDERDRVSWFRMFRIFGGCDTLKEAREFVTEIFAAGLSPADVLHEEKRYPLEEFSSLVRNERIVVFDTETTGLDTSQDNVIQIAAVEIIRGEKGREFEVHLKTRRSLEETERIHNISARFLEEHGVDPKEGLRAFAEFVAGDRLVAHNLSFDREMLLAAIERSGVDDAGLKSLAKGECFDTLDLTRILHPKRLSYTLEDLLADFSVPGENTHNALDDVRATANLILRLLPDIEKRAVALRERCDNDPRLRKLREKLSGFWVSCLRRLDEPTTLSDFVVDFLSFAGERAGYELDRKDLGNVAKLRRHMEKHCAAAPLKTLLKKRIPEYRYFREADLVTGDERIVVSTVHKAKGLQFENVVVPECVEGVYPWWNAETDEARNEDARVLYVAMTRAMKRLILTNHTIFVNQWGKRFPKRRSPFLECVGPCFRRMNLLPLSMERSERISGTLK